jgi:predicted RNA-binding Zn-ribbon protein involved in translation (DUF1610 family)
MTDKLQHSMLISVGEGQLPIVFVCPKCRTIQTVRVYYCRTNTIIADIQCSFCGYNNVKLYITIDIKASYNDLCDGSDEKCCVFRPAEAVKKEGEHSDDC